MNKTDLIQKIKQLEGISQDERSYLINLVNTKKKYGLVWEDKPEDVEEQLRESLPVLKEVKEKRILAAKLSKTKSAIKNPELFEAEDRTPPNHILIEGDNLHALTALIFTHEGKIDVFYIDPPYNTGNKDFKYNDHFVDKQDSYRHSKWLSFMDKRLRIAKRLLSEKGVIFISIDDNEQAQLKLLCDEIFGEENFVSEIAVINNLKGRSDDKYIATAHEHMLIIKKGNFETLGISVPEEYVDEYKLEDEIGKYRLQGLRKRGSGSRREDRPNMYYPFYYAKAENKISLTRNSKSDIEILPKLSNRSDGRWRWSKETAMNRIHELQITLVRTRNEYDISQKDYLQNDKGELKRIKPKSFWIGSEFSSDAGTKSLKEILPNNNFNNPKAVDLIKLCLEQSSKRQSIILDFFSGSGTTLHATMQLNAEDGGNRQCILITNNENNICEEVTYERNKRVIEGYTNAKGVAVEGLINNNLRYYKSEFVSRNPSIKNKKELTQLATELLCIKEDIYTEQKAIGDYKLNSTYVKCFQRDNLYLLVIYNEEAIEQIAEVIQNTVNKQKRGNLHFKIYVFSNGQYPYTEEFEDVLEDVTLCALPDAIYKAYQNVLPKRHRKTIPELEEETAEQVEDILDKIPDLFNQS